MPSHEYLYDCVYVRHATCRSRRPTRDLMTPSNDRRCQSQPSHRASKRIRGPSYNHKPLQESRSIRLLYLIAYDPEKSEVFATLKEHSLNNLPDFWALSYTWGKSVQDVEGEAAPSQLTQHPLNFSILPSIKDFHALQFPDDNIVGSISAINKKSALPLNLTSNLAEFLVSILEWSSKDSGMGERTIYPLWIDAICIDQRSNEEKSAQIPLMGDVYGSASKTILYLGNQNTDFDSFLWMHKTILPAMKEMKARCSSSEEFNSLLRKAHPTTVGFWEKYLTIKLEASEWEGKWRAYSRFLKSRQWFYRGWVVQEAILSSDIIPLCSGSFDLPWDEMVELVTFLTNASWQMRFIYDFGDNHGPALGLLDIDALRKTCRYFDSRLAVKGSRPSMDDWSGLVLGALGAVRRRETTMPEDRINAFLGLAERFLPEDQQQRFPTGNTIRSVNEIYISFAKYFIEVTGNLRLLAYVEDDAWSIQLGLPSWVPDFSARAGAAYRMSSAEYDACCLDSWRQVTPKFMGNELVTQGAKLTVLQGVYNPCVVESWMQILNQLGPYYVHTNQESDEALWRTLILDEGPDGRGPPADPYLGRGFRCWYQCDAAEMLARIWREIPENLRPLIDSALLYARSPEPENSFLPTEDEIKAHCLLHQDEPTLGLSNGIWSENRTGHLLDHGVEYLQRAQKTASYRGMCLTKNGLLGMCAQSCEQGDEVWLLAGSNVPCILQPKEGNRAYKFMGECYLHGAMSGEFATEELEEVVTTIHIV